MQICVKNLAWYSKAQRKVPKTKPTTIHEWYHPYLLETFLKVRKFWMLKFSIFRGRIKMLMIDNPVKTQESLLLKEISYVLNLLLPQNIKVGTFAISRSRAHWSFQTAAAFINTIKEDEEKKVKVKLIHSPLLWRQ